MADERWYETFFEGVALELWRKAVPPEMTRAEVDFLERALALPPAGRVLDVPCGSGRHAVPLAKRGYRLTGVDLSAEQIAEARRRGAEAGVAVDWRHADMRDLPAQAEFDGAYCMGNSFGYIDPAGTRAFLAAVARALRPGARFVLDTGAAAESILPRLREREWSRVDEILFLEENRYDPVESRIETRYTFVRDGVAQTRAGLQWVYTVRELRALLAAAGLAPREILGSTDGAPFDIGTPVLYLVAEKD